MLTHPFPRICFALLAIITLAVQARPGMNLELSGQTPAREDEFISVDLILREQVQFSELYLQVLDLPKSQRRERAIAELRSLAQRTQADLLADLRELEVRGKAVRVRPLWISNVIAVQIQADVLPDLLIRHPEIARVHGEASAAGAIPPPDKVASDGLAGTEEIGWGVQDINAPEVWGLGYYGQGVIVGHIDTGVDYTHPDLAGNIWINAGEDLNGNGVVDTTDWNGLDDDGNGYVDDLRGWNFDNNSPQVLDNQGNGTATAGIILGDGTGGNQTGVAPQARVMILKSTYLESDFWEAQQYALLMGADLVGSSLAYLWRMDPKPDYATMRQIADMELAAGIIHANAIGNEGDNLGTDPLPFNMPAPANCPPPWLHPDQPQIGGVSAILGAAAYDINHQLKAYSSIGPAAWNLQDILNLCPSYPYQASWPVQYNDYPYQQQGLVKPDLAAPTDVVTTALGGGYEASFGWTTASMSHTAGALCLLLTIDPDASPETLGRILLSTALDQGAPGMDNYWGAGRLDVYAAAAQLLSEISGSLCGTVSDSITGSPIAGAGVEMPELQIWAQTDTSGHYFLPSIPPGIYEVRFSAAGYDTLIVPEVAIALGVAETLSVALAGPHIWVEVQEIAGELTWGDSLQVPVIVHNTGSADLAVNFVKEGEWEPFELYLSLPVQTLTGDSKLFGVEIADSSFWISGGNNDLEPNHLYRFSFDGQIQAILDQPPTGSTWGWYDLAWDGQYLYGSSGDLLIGMDAEGTVRDSIAGPLALHRALAYDPATDHFFAGDNTSDIVEFDRSGAVIHSWPHDLHVQGLAWHPQSPEGYSLYIFSQDGPELQQVSKLNPATGAILYVTDLPGVPGEQAGGATISSDLDPDRWCLVTLIQGAAGGFDRVDVRSLEAYAPWLEVEPEAQVIPADGTLEATAILDGAAVPPGEYGINLVIEHNAADPEVVIPASLIVQPTGVEEPSEVQLPAAFAVGPVYPNPFNAQTIIPIALPERSQITMTLYNLMGQRVISIYDGIQDAGQAKVRFDLPYLTSGVYFYRVEAKGLERGGKFEDCGKMLLLK